VIPNALNRQIIDRDENKVESTFDTVEFDQDVAAGSRNLNSEVQSHLKELGYL
jgi:hypothetical protein